MRFHTPLTALAALVLSLALAGGAEAQNRNDAECAPNDRACLTQPKGKARPRSSGPAAKPAEKHGPAVGDSARAGRPLKQAGNSRFQAPGKGREYRVVDDRVVLVDSDTLKIVSVLGLLGALTD